MVFLHSQQEKEEREEKAIKEQWRFPLLLNKLLRQQYPPNFFPFVSLSLSFSYPLYFNDNVQVLLTLFPRSQIDIYIQVLQSDGGDKAAAINASTLALIDAGVPMRDFVCACTAGCIDGIPLLGNTIITYEVMNRVL